MKVCADQRTQYERARAIWQLASTSPQCAVGEQREFIRPAFQAALTEFACDTIVTSLLNSVKPGGLASPNLPAIFPLSNHITS